MSTNDQAQGATRQAMKRRDFLKRAGWGSVGATGLIIGASRSRCPGPSALALSLLDSPERQAPEARRHPDAGLGLGSARARSTPDEFRGALPDRDLVYNRLVRYPFTDEAKNNADLTLKGDLAESWEGSADFKTWTFKLRQGVKWHNVPPLNGRELVADDIKYCLKRMRRKACSRSPSRRSRAWRRRTSTRCASISRRPTRCSRRTWRKP